MPDDITIERDGFSLRLSTREVTKEMEDAFQQTNELLGRQFQKEITSDKWAWPTTPSPRDIVDTGQLRDSYEGDPVGPREYQHTYNTRYALAVHEGAVFRDGHSMPARPWMRQGLKDFDFVGAMRRLIRRGGRP